MDNTIKVDNLTILSIAFLRRARTETKAAEERIAALKGDL